MTKTVLRGAYGLFYDEYMGLFYNRTIQGQPWVADATLVGPLPALGSLRRRRAHRSGPLHSGPEWRFPRWRDIRCSNTRHARGLHAELERRART